MQSFIRWALGLLLGSEGSRKHVMGMYALTLIYALGAQAGAPEWAPEWITYAALGIAGANVGEWAMRRRAPTPTPAAAPPSPHHPTAAGAGASAP